MTLSGLTHGFTEWDSVPGQNADLAITVQSYSQGKTPFYFFWRQGQALHFHLGIAGHEVMHNVTRGFSSDSKVKWQVCPCLNHKRKLLVLAEYLRKNGLS